MNTTLLRRAGLAVLFVACGLGVVALIRFSLLFLYGHNPHIEVVEQRTTSQPQTVQVREPPAVGDVMIPGTRFVLVGYPYKVRKRNRFTGEVYEHRSERFDVIEWHVVPPYFISNGGEEVESSVPAGWKSEAAPAQFVSQSDRRRKEC